jgi:hypothetical protein
MMAFRPSLNEGQLEDRLVLSTGTSAHVRMFFSGVRANVQATPAVHQLPFANQIGSAVAIAKNQVGNTLADLRSNLPPDTSFGTGIPTRIAH